VAAGLREGGYVTAPDETLTVHFEPSGSETLGSALAIETEPIVDGGSGEVRVLLPNGRGGWVARAIKSPGATGSSVIFEDIYSDVVGLLFGGKYRVWGVDQVVPSEEPPALQPLQVTTAHHSRSGQVAGGESGLRGMVLEPGDWLDLRFDVPEGGAATRDVFLKLQGSTGPASPTRPRPMPNPELPLGFVLEQSVPNPFGDATLIRFALPTRSEVSLELFDLNGRRVRALARGELAAGFHQVDWDGRDEAGRLASPGVYMYRLTAGQFQASKRLIFMP
jgi:hypothetical protein